MRLKTKLQCKEELKPSKWKTEESISNQIKVILDEDSSFNKAVDATHYKTIFSTLQERIDIFKSQQITKNGKLNADSLQIEGEVNLVCNPLVDAMPVGKNILGG